MLLLATPAPGPAAGFIPTPGHFFFMFLVFFLAITMFTYLGQFLVFLTPSQGLGQILASGEPHPQLNLYKPTP